MNSTFVQFVRQIHETNVRILDELRCQVATELTQLSQKLLGLEIAMGECPGETHGQQCWLKWAEQEQHRLNRRVRFLENRLAGIISQCDWHEAQMRARQSRAVVSTGIAPSILIGLERNGNGRKADRSVRAEKLAKSRADAALRASMRGHNAAPPKYGWRKSKHKRGQAA